MKIKAVIGKNFGDEGKGLAVNRFAQEAKKAGENTLVIRHNGGAQAGHTVDLTDGRFIFHQLSSGSFAGADTLWSETYLPDLYKVGEEMEQFAAVSGSVPRIYADSMCRCTYIDDILINMALEMSRGANRHGSCGMGINECVERSAKMPLRLGKVVGMTVRELFSEFKNIRRNYLPYRLNDLGLDLNNAGEYGELLQSDDVLWGAAEQMIRNVSLIGLFDNNTDRYDNIIFEGAQGLLLDEFYLKYEPHLTTSRTGSVNPADYFRKHFAGKEMELVYITRTYVTRHGNGPLPYSDRSYTEKYNIIDLTNSPNPWQGTMRFAPHGNMEEFLEPVCEDIENVKDIPHKTSLLITHINETNGNICTSAGEIHVNVFIKELSGREIFDNIYTSDSKYR